VSRALPRILLAQNPVKKSQKFLLDAIQYHDCSLTKFWIRNNNPLYPICPLLIADWLRIDWLKFMSGLLPFSAFSQGALGEIASYTNKNTFIYLFLFIKALQHKC